MRKRRRLADKLTIMVCAVLVAVSAFFYVPMEVSASNSVSGSISDSLIGPGYNSRNYLITSSTSFSGNYSEYVRFVSDVDLNFSVSPSLSVFAFSVIINFDDFSYCLDLQRELLGAGLVSNYSNVYHLDVIVPSSALSNVYFDVACVYHRGSGSNVSTFVDFDFTNVSITNFSSSSGSDYENGYTAGFSAGEQAGYGNGYSQGFADGEASVDTNEIYNQGFNAGKDSVDTQSYYDAGFQAGYQVAYQEGFDSGYDEGYQSAMDRIDGWGADTTDYPVLLLDKPLMSRVFDITAKSSIPTQYIDYGEWTFDYNLNPNHIYRFDVVLNPTEYKGGADDVYFLNEDIFYLNVGGIKYRISNFSNAYVNTFFVPGDRMSSAYGFSWEPILAIYGDTFESATAYCYYDLNYKIFDMGPSGDTQNHIANQTDSLTNGFNDSHGNSVNNEFSSGLNDFETAEDSLFATATTGMKDFTFFDISSVPAMVTGMSFVGSIMSGWFTQAGGASGVGIVLSILFSIMLVAMVLGLYRWYQSKGGKD